ncbi:aminopeptidase P N-terminal domain-containing protein [Luteitalea sp.]|jgi:Xaa-Pro aminopeptidase|uniref:aminopeptidase P N-terminal domain-containing protein n=1 Tax=Luteitalea sp. TaxID=2004800 RepID=UPI0037CA7555
MKASTRTLATLLLASTFATSARAQDTASYQTDFPREEFAARRAAVFERIGRTAVAVVQGAANVGAFARFRQTNEFYYLTGVEIPHAYVLLDGRSRRTVLYVPHRNEARERNEGKVLSAEDAALIVEKSGVDEVHGVELLAQHLSRALIKPPTPQLYTLFSPAEGRVASRDEILTGIAGNASDPWDGRATREGTFIGHLRARFPQFSLHDLTPILDDLRLVKSPREIDLIRQASQLAALAITEAMRSTQAGVMEYQLDAAARYVYQLNGARDEGYASITAGGTNAWWGHYFHNNSALKDGDLVLMDYAPDLRYYTSDIARMWPVNGRFSAAQRPLYEFIAAYRDALVRHIKPGLTADEIQDRTAADMAKVIDTTRFANPNHERAAREALKFRGHLSHPVGMTVHDVGTYRTGPLKPGQVFSIDPMLWVPEERLYVRVEDVVVVTETGVENFTDFLAVAPAAIEAIVAEPGMVQWRGATSLPLKR